MRLLPANLLMSSLCNQPLHYWKTKTKIVNVKACYHNYIVLEDMALITVVESSHFTVAEPTTQLVYNSYTTVLQQNFQKLLLQSVV